MSENLVLFEVITSFAKRVALQLTLKNVTSRSKDCLARVLQPPGQCVTWQRASSTEGHAPQEPLLFCIIITAEAARLCSVQTNGLC